MVSCDGRLVRDGTRHVGGECRLKRFLMVERFLTVEICPEDSRESPHVRLAQGKLAATIQDLCQLFHPMGAAALNQSYNSKAAVHLSHKQVMPSFQTLLAGRWSEPVLRTCAQRLYC